MNTVLAQSVTLPDSTTISGPVMNFSTLGDIISKAIPFVFAFAGLFLLLMLIRAGFTLLTSAGDAKKLDTGKQQITYALVGFLIIFVGYWLVQIVGRILGFTEITSVFQ